MGSEEEDEDFDERPEGKERYGRGTETELLTNSERCLLQREYMHKSALNYSLKWVQLLQ